jgi:hypothetical protein
MGILVEEDTHILMAVFKQFVIFVTEFQNQGIMKCHKSCQSFPPGLRELRSLFSVPPVPAATVVFLMRQERPDVDMPLRLPLLRRLCIVDDGYKPVPVVPNINMKDDVAFYRIGIRECSADRIKIVPANRLDNGGPGCHFVRCIWVGFHRLRWRSSRTRFRRCPRPFRASGPNQDHD